MPSRHSGGCSWRQEGEISGLYKRLLGYTRENPKVSRKEKLKEASGGPSGPTPGLHKASIAKVSMLTHLPFLLDCAVSPVGRRGHVIYKTAHISVIKVFLYQSSFNLHTVNVVLNHDSACLSKK